MTVRMFAAWLYACLSLGLVPGREAPASATRSRQTPAAATPSHATHMLFDAALGQVVLLTASDASPSQQMWAWNGTQWRRIGAAGPPVRELGAAASDLRRKRLIMHGGMGLRDREDRRGDTWEWDGQTWQRMSDTRVGTRDHHVMAYDENRGRTVMFGGNRSGDGLETDTWEWDGVAWRQVATQGPGGRAHTAMVYDSTRKRVVLFGGLTDGYRVMGDTWTWNGTVWTKLADAGPPPRSHHRMAFDGRTGVVVLYGGLRRGRPTDALDDTWVLDGDQWKSVETTGPEKRSGHVMAYDPARQKTVLFGGGSFDGKIATNHDDTWEWDGRQWTQLHPGSRTTRRVGPGL